MITPICLSALLLILFEIAKLCEFDSAGSLAGVAFILATPFIVWDGSQLKNDTELAVVSACGAVLLFALACVGWAKARMANAGSAAAGRELRH